MNRRPLKFLSLVILSFLMVGILPLSILPVYALDEPFENSGFESGLTGWSLSDAGSISVQTAVNITTGDIYEWDIIPYNNLHMAQLIPNTSVNETQMYEDLLMNDASINYIESNYNITNTAYIFKDIDMAANQSFSMAWHYLATDYDPFNDASFCSFVKVDDETALPIITTSNSVLSQVSLLGATVASMANYTTGDYGSTGWQTVSFKATQAGTYRIGFAVFNEDDTALSPYLFVDDKVGTTFKNDEPFGAVDPDEDAPEPPGEVIDEEEEPVKKSKAPGRHEVVTLLTNPLDPSGVRTVNLNYYLASPEIWHTDVKNLTVWLETEIFDLAMAQKKAKLTAGLMLLRDYNIRLMMKIVYKDGRVEVKEVDNADIKRNIPVMIPIGDWASIPDLGVVYIDTNGNTANLPVNRVTMDGIEYLQFENNHFSEYGIVSGAKEVTPTMVPGAQRGN